jgi:hypothetical protein
MNKEEKKERIKGRKRENLNRPPIFLTCFFWAYSETSLGVATLRPKKQMFETSKERLLTVAITP